MKLIKATAVIILILLSSLSAAFTQNKYSILSIPPELKKQANVVVREYSTELEILAPDKAILKVKKIYSVLNQAGKKEASMIVPYDKLIKINDLGGAVYNMLGKKEKRIRNKDIQDYSFYGGSSLYEDNRVKYIPPPDIKAPYTIKYEYELEFNGILAFPDWFPQRSYNHVSVENASLDIIIPPDVPVKIYDRYFTGKKKSRKEGELTIKSFRAENLPAIEKEEYAPPQEEALSHIRIVPQVFEVEGYAGNLDSWNDFGEWIGKLNKNRQNLPEETVKEIQELTSKAKSKREKAKLIYEYMQNKTRYVNIAVGIGGWQPFDAQTVNNTGYGDCKALSNYTAALLESAGIESYYTLINAGNKSAETPEEFPANRFNHVILAVPLEKDTVWLECTSQKMPFGYLGSFTDNRNALLITPEGGKLCRTPKYGIEQTQNITKLQMDLSENGDASITMLKEAHGIFYDKIHGLHFLSNKEKEKKIKKILNIAGLNLKNIKTENHKTDNPVFSLNVEFEVSNYFPVSSKRIFAEPLKHINFEVPKKYKQRKTDLYINRSYRIIDSVRINLPEGYQAEFIPDNVNIKNKFGKHSLTYQNKETYLYVTRIFEIYKGQYPPEAYAEFRKFLVNNKKDCKQNIILKKAE